MISITVWPRTLAPSVWDTSPRWRPGSRPCQVTVRVSSWPAFTLDGNIVGIFVMRVIKSTGGGGGMGGDPNMTSIVLPAADIAEGAKQAPGFDGK